MEHKNVSHSDVNEPSNTPKLLAITVSCIVGVSSFFNYKLVAMIPVNLLALVIDKTIAEGISAFVFIACIYWAQKNVKHINALQTRKERRIKRIKTVVIGSVSIVLSTLILSSSNFWMA